MPIDQRLTLPAHARQLDLPEAELQRLAQQIEEDYQSAIVDHQARMERFRRYYQRWRGRTDPRPRGEEDLSNFLVPITQWHTYSKLAKENSALFGEDAEVVAAAVGPEDQKLVHKVGRYITWRLFNSMKIEQAATVFNFRKILCGRAIAYTPWERQTFQVPMRDGTWKEEVAYEGPGFYPEWPDDVIVPAQDVDSIQKFDFVIRRKRVRPDDLLRGDGKQYFGIAERFEEILRHAEQRKRDQANEPMKEEKDLAEGVLYEGSLTSAGELIMYEWYGRWRMLKGKYKDARRDNLERREAHETDLLIRYLPDLNMVVGAQRLAEMYPLLPDRRPFEEASLVRDGSYWCPSFGELLESVERELSRNHNTSADSTELSVGPLIFYRPGSGFAPDKFQYGPRTAVPVDNPQTDVRALEIRSDLQAATVREQTLNGYAERVTGQSDMTMGRAIDRPNAPRTARQTVALLEEGDIRASLELSALRDDWSKIIQRFWKLDSMYAPEKMFFRVTEEEANGLFDVSRGGAYMTSEERGGNYDFKLKFATSAISRETRKQEQLALYQLDLGNPLVIQNPRALWYILNRVHKAFGDDQFATLVPEPQDAGIPVSPKVELTRALQGEELFVNPMDNDQLHLLEHNRALAEMKADPNRDEQAFRILATHALDHISQMQEKKLMQQLAASVVDGFAQNTATGRGLQMQGAPLGLQTLQAMLQTLSASQGMPGLEQGGSGESGGSSPGESGPAGGGGAA